MAFQSRGRARGGFGGVVLIWVLGLLLGAAVGGVTTFVLVQAGVETTI